MKKKKNTVEENLFDIKEFFIALNELEKAKKLDKELVISSIEAGLAAAYKKEMGECCNVNAKLCEETGKVEFYAYQEVVENPTEDNQLSLEEARDIKPDAQIGEIIGKNITTKALTRIAAQTGKQVITQRINEAVRAQVAKEMNNKEGELVYAIVRRMDANNVYVEIINSQMEGVMSMSDQVYGEKLNIGDKIHVYVKKVRESDRGTQVVVSRSCAGFVKKLFEIEVPEMRSNLVLVKSIVREAGNRTKMAVYSEDPNLDALAACVGQKGERVNSVVGQLNGEKIDIILYTPQVEEYIKRALNPAKSIVSVKLDEDNKHAQVIVADDKLSLAIGKGGMNARLAARLTGVKLDIKPLSALTADLTEEN